MKLREIRKKNAHNAGFTLLELVIVLAVIAILSAILIPTFTDVISRAKETAARQNCRSVAEQYMLYRLEEGDSSDLGGYLFISGDYAFVLENGELQETEITEEAGIIYIKDGESSFSCEEQTLPSVIAMGDVKVYYAAEKVAYEKCRAALRLANSMAESIDITKNVFVYGSYVFYASEGALQKMDGITASDGLLQGAAAETYQPDSRFTEMDTDGVVIYTSDASHFEASGSQAGAQELPDDPDAAEPPASTDPDAAEPPASTDPDDSVTAEPDEEPEQTEAEAMALCMTVADAVEDVLAESGITNYYGNLYVSGEYAFYRFNSSELAAADASFQAGELQSVTIDGLVISDWERYSTTRVQEEVTVYWSAQAEAYRTCLKVADIMEIDGLLAGSVFAYGEEVFRYTGDGLVEATDLTAQDGELTGAGAEKYDLKKSDPISTLKGVNVYAPTGQPLFPTR